MQCNPFFAAVEARFKHLSDQSHMLDHYRHRHPPHQIKLRSIRYLNHRKVPDAQILILYRDEHFVVYFGRVGFGAAVRLIFQEVG